MAKKQIVLSGVGGQGLVSAGGMLAEAVAKYENRESLMCCAYGSEARGTFTKAEVIIDDKRIYFPEVQNPDIVIALHQIAYDRYADKLTGGSKLIYDSDCVVPKDSAAEQIGLPISSVAESNGAVGSQNIVMLGILSSLGGIADMIPLEKMVEKKFAAKPKAIEKNLKVLHAGFEMVSKSVE